MRRTAARYASRMHRLGVRMDLAPVADLAVRGAYIDRLGRAFGDGPVEVTRRVRAWRLGMAEHGVVTVLKHWPGHGHARNSHTGPARVPRLRVLERRDLVPFEHELSDGAPAVMVGHLLAKGLTRRGVPASLSPRALRYLRASAGPDTVKQATARSAENPVAKAAGPDVSKQVTVRSDMPVLRAPAPETAPRQQLAMRAEKPTAKNAPQAPLERKAMRTTRASWWDWLFGR